MVTALIVAGVTALEVGMVVGFALKMTHMVHGASQARLSIALPTLTVEAAKRVIMESRVALLAYMVLTGFAVATLVSGTWRDARPTLLLYLAGIAIILVWEYTGFGFPVVATLHNLAELAKPLG
jgi:hypothetical protein